MGDIVRLRDLPGIAQVEAMCRAGKPFDPPHLDVTLDRLDEVSVSLFGITRYDTLWEDGDEWDWEGEDSLTPEEYLERFKATEVPWHEAEPYWALLGWDLTDGRGSPLICSWCFDRQIISAIFGLNEGARLTLDGSGKWPDETGEAAAERRLQAWKADLEKEALAFLQQRKC